LSDIYVSINEERSKPIASLKKKETRTQESFTKEDILIEAVHIYIMICICGAVKTFMKKLRVPP